MDYGLWTMDHGLWTMDHGPWTMDYGSWTMYHVPFPPHPPTPNDLGEMGGNQARRNQARKTISFAIEI